MRSTFRGGLGLLLAMMVSGAALAQPADCTAAVQAVVEAARAACTEIGVGQLCRATDGIELTAREGRTTADEPISLGAVAGLTGTLEASAAPPLALLRVRAGDPNTALMLVVMGDAQLDNLGSADDSFLALEAVVRPAQGANLRLQPDAASPVVRALNSGDRVLVIGRLADSSWLRLRDGWAAVETLRTEGDPAWLPVLPPDSQAADRYGPMQAFRFRASAEAPGCRGALPHGLLAQSSDGQAVSLQVNGALLVVEGTLLLTSTDEGQTVLSALEGMVRVGDELVLEAGRRLRYGYQGEALVYEPLGDYDYAQARFLPLALLPREFPLPFSLGGVIFPFTPGTGFLQTVSADDACTAAWSADVNLRAGPGLEYPIRRGVPGGFYGLPDGRSTSADGAVWWRLTDDIWVAADVTAAAGACGLLPLVAPPPL